MRAAGLRLAVAVGVLLVSTAVTQSAASCPGVPGCNLQQGSCKQIPDTTAYTCACNAGWKGSNCTDAAAPAPAPAATAVGNSSDCQPSCFAGTCVKYSNGTSACDCSGTPYTGKLCSVDPNGAAWQGGSRQCNGGTGCLNGGRCIQQQDSSDYTCQCTGISFHGAACEIADSTAAQPPASAAAPTRTSTTQTSTEGSVGSSVKAATSLSGGAVVGIMAVVLVAFLVVIAGIVFWRRRRSAGKFEKCLTKSFRRFSDRTSMEIQAPYGASSIQGRI